MLNSSTYVPYYCWQKEYGAPIYKLKIGGTTKCLRCGEDEICNTDTMMCKTCELEYGNSEGDDFVFCEICGERMLTEEGIYCSGLGYVCEDCYRAQCTQCYSCGEVILTSRAVEHEGETYCIYCHPDNRVSNSNIETLETLINPIAERVEQLFF